MKIVLVNSTYTPDVIGGAELSVQYLAESLAERGHEVVVIAMGPKSALERVGPVHVHRVRLRNLYWPNEGRHAVPARIVWNALDIANPWMARATADILKRERPEVVHTNNLQGLSPLVWKAAHDLGMPVVHTIRDLYLLCPKSAMHRRGSNCTHQCMSCRLFATPKKALSRFVDRVVGISEFILNRHVELGWFPRAERSVIRNSFPRPRLTAAPTFEGKIRFGYLGRLDQRKGVERLLAAFRRPAICERSTLVLGGDGDPGYVESLRRQCAGLPVRFLGWTAPQEFFPQIDVLVVPSLVHEALGRVIIEAYAYGRPVVASRRGGISEIVVSGKTGYLFDPEEDGDLEQALVKVASTASRYKDMVAATLKANAQFDPSVIAAHYERQYTFDPTEIPLRSQRQTQSYMTEVQR